MEHEMGQIAAPRGATGSEFAPILLVYGSGSAGVPPLTVWPAAGFASHPPVYWVP